MKPLITTVLFLLTTSLFGQRPLEIVVDAMPPYSRNIQDYQLNANRYTLSVYNHTFTEQNVYFRSEIRQIDGDVYAGLHENYKPSQSTTLQPQQLKVFTNDELEMLYSDLTEDQVIVEGINITGITNGTIGQLPEGTYDFCIVAYDYDTDIQMSIGCSFSFTLGYDGVIEILTPMEEEVITTEAFPISWDPHMDPMVTSRLEYNLKLIDLTTYNETYGSPFEVFNEGAVEVHFETNLDLGTQNYNYNADGADPLLTDGHLYGIRVQAIDPMMEVEFQNEGYSEIRTFYYMTRPGDDSDDNADPGFEPPSLPDDCASRCEIPEFNNQVPSDLSGRTTISMGYFTISNLDLIPVGNTYSGSGKITIDFLNNITIPVALTGIQINNEGRVISGVATAEQDNIGDISALYDELNLGVLEANEDFVENYISQQILPEQAASLGTYLRDFRMLGSLVAGGEIGMPLAVSQSVSGNDFTLGVTAMTFTPDGAKCRVLAGCSLASFERENWILFEGKGVCLHPKGFGGDFTLQLGSDLVLGKGNVNEYELVFNGSGETGDGCYVNMDCNGLSQVHMAGAIKMSRNHFLPDSAGTGMIDTGQVKGMFSFDLEKSQSDVEAEENNSSQGAGTSHWVADLSFDPFQIKGLDGWTFTIEEATLDMSDLANSDNVIFPENYTQTGPTFRGLSFRQISVQAPPQMQVKKENTAGGYVPRKKVRISDMIVELDEKPALYLKAEAQNLIEAGDGSMDGWAFKMDLFRLEIFNNHLQKGYLEGGVSMPFMDSSEYLEYDAQLNESFDDAGDKFYSYEFNVLPSADINMPIFIANARIDNNSYVSLRNQDGNRRKFEAVAGVFGDLTVNTEEHLPESLEDLAIPASIFLPELEFGLVLSSVSGFDEENCTFGFASPNKFLNNLPINLTNLGLVFEDGGLGLKGDLGLKLLDGENDLGVTTSFKIGSNLGLSNLENGNDGYARNLIRHFKLESVTVDGIEVDAEFSGITINGRLDFYNNELDGGGRDKGVEGDIRANFPLGIELGVAAKFGTYGTPPLEEDLSGQGNKFDEDYYSYFYLDGSAVFQQGIPMGPMSINGFGGGVAYNMEYSSQNLSIDNGEVSGSSTFEPSFGSFWFKGMMGIALTNQETTFNADISVAAQFNKSDGLTNIGVTGLGYFMTPIADRQDPEIMLGVDFQIYPSTEIQDFSMTGEFITLMNMELGDVGTLKGGVTDPAQMTFKGRTYENVVAKGDLLVNNDMWYLHVGQPAPDRRGKLLLNLGTEETEETASGGAELSTYLMVGHNVPTDMPELPQEIVNILNAGTEGASSDSSPEEALVSPTEHMHEFNSGQGFAHGAHFRAEANIEAFIIKASLRAYLGHDINITKTEGIECSGIGERGINGWYGQGQAYCGLAGELALSFKLFGRPRDFDIGSFAVAMALRGGVPRPTYFEGIAGVRYELLNGMIEGKSSFRVMVGEKCRSPFQDPLAGINFIENISPKNEEKDVFISSRIEADFALPMEKVMTIEEVIEDGNDFQTITHYYKPYVASIQLHKSRNRNDVVLMDRQWNSNNNVLRLQLQKPLNERTRYTFTIKIKAKECSSAHSCQNNLKVDGRDWFQEKEVTFTTGDHPSTLYPLALNSVPGHMQPYWIKENAGHLLTAEFDKDKIFFSEHLLKKKTNCTYHVRFTNINDGSTQEVQLSRYRSGDKKVRFPIPQLESNGYYAWQIIRKYNPLGSINAKEPANGQGQVLGSLTRRRGQVSDSLSTSVEKTGFATSTNKNEDVLYHSFFTVSQYATLKDKWEGLEQEVHVFNKRYNSGSRSWAVVSYTGEPFARQDFYPYNPISAEFKNDGDFLPRIIAMDEMKTNFHSNVKSSLKEAVDFLRTYRHAFVYPGGSRFIPDLDQLNYDWTADMQFRMLSDRYSGGLAPLLRQSQVMTEQFSIGGISSPSGNTVKDLDQGPRSENKTFSILHDEHLNFQEDKNKVAGWLISAMLCINEKLRSQANSHLQRVLASDYSLYGNQGSYQLRFTPLQRDEMMMSSDMYLWTEKYNYLPDGLNPFQSKEKNLPLRL